MFVGEKNILRNIKVVNKGNEPDVQSTWYKAQRLGACSNRT